MDMSPPDHMVPAQPYRVAIPNFFCVCLIIFIFRVRGLNTPHGFYHITGRQGMWGDLRRDVRRRRRHRFRFSRFGRRRRSPRWVAAVGRATHIRDPLWAGTSGKASDTANTFQGSRLRVVETKFTRLEFQRFDVLFKTGN